jgi:hypothetical protein
MSAPDVMPAFFMLKSSFADPESMSFRQSCLQNCFSLQRLFVFVGECFCAQHHCACAGRFGHNAIQKLYR